MAKITFNEAQLSELKSMLDAGEGEAQIAKHFNISSDALRRIRKENDLMLRHMTCKLCGQTYTTTKANRTLCPSTHYRKCAVCGSEFVVSYDNINVKTCSPKCTGLYKSQEGISKSAYLKAASTWMDKYGVDNPAKADLVKDKARATFTERYGVNSAMELPEFATKCIASRESKDIAEQQRSIAAQRDTMYKIYGGYPAESNSLLDPQMVATMNERYDSDSALSNLEVRKKIQNTNIERYGQPWYVMTEDCQSSGNVISKLNLLFAEKLKEAGLECELEYKIDRKSYDIKVRDILVEIDPTYTHNSFDNHWHNPLPSNYHKEKTDVARNHGFRCIHVFDWDSWDSIINLLIPTQAIYARECTVAKVDKCTADLFTDTYHIQGKCNGQVNNWGLYYNGELVEIMTFGRPRYSRSYDFELLRLCTKKGLTVSGGASRLFKHFTEENKQCSIISYCDLSKFTGSVYEAIGMKLHHVSPPAKVWSKGSDKITDNLLRQRGFDQLFKTSYGKGSSNEALMLADGWLPVFDCGQAAYIYC